MSCWGPLLLAAVNRDSIWIFEWHCLRSFGAEGFRRVIPDAVSRVANVLSMTGLNQYNNSYRASTERTSAYFDASEKKDSMIA
jgi:hypothetical protein